MAIAASASLGVLLAGGTQMLAVYALAQALSQHLGLGVHWDNIVVGTTRWVAEDPSADTVGLARLLADVPLLATELNFTDSRYPQLQLYERGFVKEGVGAGGSAIAASLYQGWTNQKLLTAIEELVSKS
jgi:NaMN:DMB phosphoribosyltransferase